LECLADLQVILESLIGCCTDINEVREGNFKSKPALTGYPAVIEGFSNASWCSKPDQCRSTRDFVFTMGGAAIS